MRSEYWHVDGVEPWGDRGRAGGPAVQRDPPCGMGRLPPSMLLLRRPRLEPLRLLSPAPISRLYLIGPPCGVAEAKLPTVPGLAGCSYRASDDSCGSYGMLPRGWGPEQGGPEQGLMVPPLQQPASQAGRSRLRPLHPPPHWLPQSLECGSGCRQTRGWRKRSLHHGHHCLCAMNHRS